VSDRPHRRRRDIAGDEKDTAEPFGRVFELIGRHLEHGGRWPRPEVNVEIVAAMSYALHALRVTGSLPSGALISIRGIDLSKAGEDSHEGKILEQVLGERFMAHAAVLGRDLCRNVEQTRSKKSARVPPSAKRNKKHEREQATRQQFA
jgi:hypothetical protein